MKRSDFFKTLGIGVLVASAIKPEAKAGVLTPNHNHSPTFLIPRMTKKEFIAIPNKQYGLAAVCENNNILVWNGDSIIQIG